MLFCLRLSVIAAAFKVHRSPAQEVCNFRKNALQTYVQMLTSVVAMADGGVSTLLVHTIYMIVYVG